MQIKIKQRKCANECHFAPKDVAAAMTAMDASTVVWFLQMIWLMLVDSFIR